MPENYFGGETAARYDDRRARTSIPPSSRRPSISWRRWRAAAPSSSRSAPGGSRSRSRSAASRSRASTSRPTWSLSCARSRAATRSPSQSATTRRQRSTGRSRSSISSSTASTTRPRRGAARELRERRRAPRAGRLLRRRGRRPERQRLEVFDLSDTHVGVDELDFDTQRLVSHHFNLMDGRWSGLDTVPLGVAGRARPDGATRGDDVARALERLEREPFTTTAPSTSRSGRSRETARRPRCTTASSSSPRSRRSSSRPSISSETLTCRRCSSC